MPPRPATIADMHAALVQANEIVGEQRQRIARLEVLLLQGLGLHGGEAHTDSEKEWRAAARKALNLARS